MKWIGFLTDKTYNFADKFQDYGVPPAYIVKQFVLAKSKKVTIKIAALGTYSLYVNGHLVNDDFMSQDLSEFDHHVFYRLFDISDYIKEGKNAIGIILCDGWYTSRLSNRGRNVFGDYPNKVCFEIFADNQLVIESDGTEKAHDGAIRAIDNQNGIIIDNNYDLGDFSSSNYDLSKWNYVETYPIEVKLKKMMIKPTIKHEVFHPTLIKKVSNHYIYDFGQNFAGVEHIVLKGNKGDKVTILHGETLNEDQTVYITNLRSALAKSTYILKGDQKEEFLPRQTFFGFRYIEVIIEGNVEILDLKAYAIYSSIKRSGVIKTNNELVNKLYSNILWGQRSNFLSIPTDCPQRDERMGWLGDAQIFSKTACYNYDSLNFYKKYVLEICASMDIYENNVPTFVPYFYRHYAGPLSYQGDWRNNAQGWSDAIIIIPFNLYLFYGDGAFLKKIYPYMKKFMRILYQSRVKNYSYNGASFGDWLSVIEETDKHLYDDAYLAYDNYLMYQIAKILNKAKDSEKYHELFQKVKEKFLKHYLKNNKLTSDTQGAYVLAHSFKLIDDQLALDNLKRKFSQYHHLTTGFHSTKFLLPLLCELGLKDIAYQLLNNKEYPSWGYMISCGATTIWERWDSYKKDSGFNKDGMNSFNHYSLGSVGEWMYSHMVGIKPSLEKPGFKKVIISPFFDKSVSKLACSYKTKYGQINVKYQIKKDIIIYIVKGNPKIEFAFAFNNKVISQEQKGDNKYIFKLEY